MDHAASAAAAAWPRRDEVWKGRLPARDEGKARSGEKRLHAEEAAAAPAKRAREEEVGPGPVAPVVPAPAATGMAARMRAMLETASPEAKAARVDAPKAAEAAAQERAVTLKAPPRPTAAN